MSVFVVDTHKMPLAPCHEAKARKLLDGGKAAIWRRYPFTIILKYAVESPVVPDLRVKLDPGSKTTGIAVVDDQSGKVVFAAELTHRGQTIKESLESRRAVRRGRRNRHTRYRQARWQNRRRREGWLCPSLQSRMANILTWVARLQKLCKLTNISMELVRFDTQLIENPEISGEEYQQGTLAGYEVREYLLYKWGRKCTYCERENIPLQIEHIAPRAKGGTNRVWNLCLACEKCNLAKGTKDIADFLTKKPDLLNKILAQAQAPLKDAAPSTSRVGNCFGVCKISVCQSSVVQVDSPSLTGACENPKNSLARCGMRGQKYTRGCKRKRRETSTHQGLWAWMSSDVSYGQIWFCTYQPQRV